jgi:cytochrome c553
MARERSHRLARGNARERIDYLIEVLKSYRDTPRPGADTAMSVPISGASDADITALAHYAASL